MSKLFDVPKAREAEPLGMGDPRAGLVTAATSRLAHALRNLKIENEFVSEKRRSLANSLDRAIASTGRKGNEIRDLHAYRQAALFYELHTGKSWSVK